MNRIKRGYHLMLVCCFLGLAACTTVSKQIQESVNSSDSSYPAATAENPELLKPLFVNLSHYKSVQTRPHQRSDIVIALAASGGGYRAANLTLGVLMGLEKIHSPGLNGNFLQEIDYFSTVSGGGFGVGYYLSQLHNYNVAGTNTPFSLQQNVNNMLQSRLENPLRIDLAEHLFFGEDRGLGLEKKLNAVILSTPEGGLTMGDVFVPKASRASVKLPYWVTNTTIYQNAAIFPFSPDILARYRVTGYYHNGQMQHLSNHFRSSEYAADMPMSIGMTASATVPFVTPATALLTAGCDSQCYLQLFDGGLADNLGIYTALSLLLQDRAPIKILLIVDAYQGSSQPYSKQLTPPDTVPLLWRVVTAGTDSSRQHIKHNIQFIGRDLLCGNGAQNVIVVYLDLSHYPEAQRVGTKLSMSAQHQKMLINVGQELVKKDPTIKVLLAQLQRKVITLGQCRKKD